MHPALSVILFSTASGAGYGLLVWIGMAYVTTLPDSPVLLVTGFLMASVLIIGGLFSSTFHLGRPERAWRSLSQWRSSWLSREGVMAILTFLPMSLLALQWLYWPNAQTLAMGIVVLTIVCAQVTVFTTSMIYASLKPIPAWANPWTSLVYLILSLMTGFLLYVTLVYFLAEPEVTVIELLAGLILSAATFKFLYWRHVSGTPSPSTSESATGLGHLGRVKQIQSPHSQENYLLKEMGFRIARKHSVRLRQLMVILGFVFPLSLALGTLFFTGSVTQIMMLLAALCMAVGVVIERWLFFAEAKHTVTLYYQES